MVISGCRLWSAGSMLSARKEQAPRIDVTSSGTHWGTWCCVASLEGHLCPHNPVGIGKTRQRPKGLQDSSEAG